MGAIKEHLISLAIICLIFLNTKVKANYLLNKAMENNIKQSINKMAKPCDNFYDYSCGNYAGYHKSDENIGEITQYLDQQFNHKLMQLLLKPANHVNLNFHDRRKQTFREKTQNYYRACVTENRKNVKKYFEVLQIRPHDGHLSFSSEDFWQILGKLQGYNWNNLIIKHQIAASKEGNLSIILKPAYKDNVQPNLPEDIAIEDFLKSVNEVNASEIVQQLKYTENKWLEIFQNYTNNGDTVTEMSFKQMAVRYPFLRIYLQQLLDIKVNKIEKILLVDIDFFNYLREIKWSSDEWQQQLDYLMVHFTLYLFKDSTTDFNANACINDLRNKLELAVNYIYYEEILYKNLWILKDDLMLIKNQMVTIVQELFEENNLNLTAEQVKNLEIKLPTIKYNFGNLPYPESSEKIEIFYKEVPDLDNRNYFKNHLLLLEHRFRKSLEYQDDLNFFITSDNSIGASSSLYYALKQNLVIVPFASLQYSLYNNTFKPLYKVSLMGFLMAHEMGHAFDTNSLMATDHSSIVEHDLYVKSLECMQNQKPTEDIEERIADLFAEHVVYRTYDKYYNTGNSRNWQREFYLNMAQFFCNKDDLEFIDHDADAVRLHQIVMNSKAFAQAFNCPLDSPMNPKEKCRLF